MQVSIQPMTLEHLDGALEVEQDSFSIPWSRDSIKSEVDGRNKFSFYYVALVDGVVAGYAGMWHVVTEGHVTNIAVKNAYRRQGIGSLLMAKLVEVAVEKEMIGLTLELRMNNQSAMGLYKKYGFIVEGLRKNYYSYTKEDAIIMWKHLI